MYSLNLAEDNRILSACVCLDGFEYGNKVGTLPDGDITDYKYINGEFIHDPLPVPVPEPAEPTAEEEALSMVIDHECRIAMLELGVTEL